MEAHSGFLNSAEILEATISKRIKELAPADVKHVLFTGHSAGGAVASLLYLSYLSRRNAECTPVTLYLVMPVGVLIYVLDGMFDLSCITFGSPPVIRSSIPSQPQPSHGKPLVLHIINEFDVVTRADRNYLLSLVNLYRSIYQMPSVREANALDDGTLHDTKSIAAYHPSSDNGSTDGVWETPSATYSHVGERVVLHMHVCDESSSGESDGHLADKLELKAYKVEARAFQKLLFCRVSVHRRIEYQNRIHLIAHGYFNSITGWEK